MRIAATIAMATSTSSTLGLTAGSLRQIPRGKCRRIANMRRSRPRTPLDAIALEGLCAQRRGPPQSDSSPSAHQVEGTTGRDPVRPSGGRRRCMDAV